MESKLEILLDLINANLLSIDVCKELLNMDYQPINFKVGDKVLYLHSNTYDHLPQFGMFTITNIDSNGYLELNIRRNNAYSPKSFTIGSKLFQKKLRNEL